MTRNEIIDVVNNIKEHNIEKLGLSTYDDFKLMCEHLKERMDAAYIDHDVDLGDTLAKALMETQNLGMTRLGKHEVMKFIANCI